MNSCKYADVIVDIAHEKLDKPFTYRIPEQLTDEVYIGAPVVIPFGQGNRTRKGYIIDIKDECNFDPSKVKDIVSSAPKQVSLEDEFIELANWMKDRYGCSLSKALKTVLPVKEKIKARNTNYNPVSDNRKEYTIHDPNDEQHQAIDTFIKDYDSGESYTYLLFGITGSGKTDVYMHMIRHVVDSGKQVILLIPEISLTYQTIDRLYSVFGDNIAVIHSKLSPGERYEQINKCRTGEANIIIGPRSALFAPFKSLGLIVIDEEHDTAYKNENIPRYNAIDVAKKRAEMHSASLVLSSATPSPDSFMRAMNGEYKLLKLNKRATGAFIPEIEIIDMREELKKGNKSIFSERIDDLIRDRLEKKEQIILFMNRRGYSNFVSCRSCGNAIRCPHCDVSLTSHIGHRLVCHYCGYAIPIPEKCPSCGSPYIAEFGVGTEKLEKLTQKMYPQARVARLDTDSASGKKASERILNDFANGNTDILIGTQMVVKGHDYHNVTLVGIMAADTSLYVSDYTSGERTYELISQAAGRAGRGSKPGCVVIQTYKPDHYAIENAASDNFNGYFAKEMAYRNLLNYPPAIHIWTVQLSSKNEEQLKILSEEYFEMIQGYAKESNAELIGPVEPSVYKVNDYFRKLIYLKHADYDILLTIKGKTQKDFQNKHPELDISILHDFT